MRMAHGTDLENTLWRSRDGARDVFVVGRYGWDGKGWAYTVRNMDTQRQYQTSERTLRSKYIQVG